MSIDARIKSVVITNDATNRGYFELIDRPGTPRGIRGQRRLSFFDAPARVAELQGRDIWGGAESIMLGDKLIARRTGYEWIVFDYASFENALAAKGAK